MLVILILVILIWTSKSTPSASVSNKLTVSRDDQINERTLTYWNNLVELEKAFAEVSFPNDQLLVDQGELLRLSTECTQCASECREIAHKLVAMPSNDVHRDLYEFGAKRANWINQFAASQDAWAIHYRSVSEHNKKYTGIRAIAEGAIRGALGDIFGKGSEAQASVEILEHDRDRLNTLYMEMMSEGTFLSSRREALQVDMFEMFGWSER